MSSTHGGGNNDPRPLIVTSDTTVMWENLALDLNLQIDPEYANGKGELVVEYSSGVRVRMGNKMKLADVRNPPVKIKCQALSKDNAQDDLYLIALLNPDVPSMDKPLQR